MRCGRAFDSFVHVVILDLDTLMMIIVISFRILFFLCRFQNYVHYEWLHHFDPLGLRRQMMYLVDTNRWNTFFVPSKILMKMIMLKSH